MKLKALKSMAVVSTVALGAGTAGAQFTGLGNAYNYAVLYNDNNQNSAVQGTVTGNVGVGTGGSLNLQGSIVGSVAFAAGNYSGNENKTPTGGVSYNVSEVNSIMSDISALSCAYTGGSALNINAPSGVTQTVTVDNAVGSGGGTLETSTTFGSAYVYNVTGVDLGGTLKLSGKSSDKVILNVNGLNGEFNGNITLSGGLTAEDVIINIIGGEFQDTSGTQNVTYVMENVGGGINVESTIDGHIFAGNSGQFDVTGSGIVHCSPVPEPGTWMAGAFLLLPVGASVWHKLRQRMQKQDAKAL